MAALVDTLLSGQLLFAALVTGSLYALVALGLNLVYGTLRMLNVAHGDVVMLGAYAAYWAFSLAGIPPVLAAPAVAALGALAGLAVHRGVVRRLFATAGAGAGAGSARLEGNSLLLFFGLSIVLQNAAALAFTPNARGLAVWTEVYHLGNVAMTGNRIAALVIAGATCIAVAALLGRSLLGLSMRAVIERREAATIVGIDVDRVQAISFALGFATAALAGALVSMLEQISPFTGFPFTIAAFIVIILGGLGNLFAGLGAALLLGALETYGVALTSANMRSVLLYGAFVAALLLFPRGLFARRARAA
jgi:branched-chain amino acid transport system permease protein